MRCFALLLVALLATTAAAGPATIANDDSCDISLLPAATLLLPYFDVDFRSPATTAHTTLFTVQNSTPQPQIARVTLWTDWAYPMLTFNIFLTGYDVQGINLWDVLSRGVIAPGLPGQSGGTSNRTTVPQNQVSGSQPFQNDQNPHFLADAATTCASNPGAIDAALLAELQPAFTTGTISRPDCPIVKNVGSNNHGPDAVGYATIDVVANCNATSPLSPLYFNSEILFDNVLLGDYQHLNPNPATGNYAGGNPLVHIRAVPEGGGAGTVMATELPYTFYDLYTTGAAARTQDRRQPLPSAFLARFIQGGLTSFNTNLQIWREAVAAPASCPLGYESNDRMVIADIVRFDEHENATYGPPCNLVCFTPVAPATSSQATTSSNFPRLSISGDVAGWVFLNLNNGGSEAYSSTRNYGFGSTTKGRRQSQAWVVTSMFAEGRFGVEMDAPAAGNGCSPAPDFSFRAAIGPAP
ncbi:MAG TPA: hypothetical protein VJZ76_09855 [Thermoanaerobaculia bacterium]|nr:hypothetical protein [Thermoanaerobaculia bacterium]